MIYGLIFLGNALVTSQQQRDVILAYAKRHNFNIDKFITYQERPDITLFKSGDTVVLFAWNCICSKRTILNTIVQHFFKNDIKMYAATSLYCVDDTVDFRQYECAFKLYEDIRYNFLSGRALCGAKVRVANGHLPGRRLGSKNKRYVTDGKERIILQMYSDGFSICAIAKKLKISAPTIKRFLNANN